MRRIKEVVVTYDDDTQETFEGDGYLRVTNTQVKVDLSDDKTREDPVKYITIGMPQ